MFAAAIALGACGSDDGGDQEGGETDSNGTSQETESQEGGAVGEGDGEAADAPAVSGDVALSEAGYTVGPEHNVVVTVYEDLACTNCAELRAELDERVNQWVDDGMAQVEFRLMTDLDPQYSADAAQVVLAYAEEAPEALNAVVRELYAQQTDKPDLSGIMDAAEEASGTALSDEARGKVEGGEYEEVLGGAASAAMEDNASWFPVVLVNGEDQGSYVPTNDQYLDDVEAAIEAAQGGESASGESASN